MKKQKKQMSPFYRATLNFVLGTLFMGGLTVAYRSWDQGKDAQALGVFLVAVAFWACGAYQANAIDEEKMDADDALAAKNKELEDLKRQLNQFKQPQQEH